MQQQQLIQVPPGVYIDTVSATAPGIYITRVFTESTDIHLDTNIPISWYFQHHLTFILLHHLQQQTDTYVDAIFTASPDIYFIIIIGLY